MIPFSFFPLFPVVQNLSPSLVTAKKAAATLTVGLLVGTGMVGLFSVSTQETKAVVLAQCNDGVDNDRDGRIDFPDDVDCKSTFEDYEGQLISQGVLGRVTDNRDAVAQGSSFTYIITLRPTFTESNFTPSYRYVNADLYLPEYVKFESATDGGANIDGRVHWDSLIVNARDGLRSMTVRVMLQKNAPENKLLTATLYVDGRQSTDSTVVRASASDPNDSFRLVLSDYQEFTLPGEILTQTLRVKNISNFITTTDIRVTLPNAAEYLDASDDPKTERQEIRWNNITFQPLEERVFTFRMRVDDRVADKSILYTRARTANIATTDRTIVRVGLPNESLVLHLSDNRTTARPGELLTYTARISNTSNFMGTQVYMTAAIPLYSDFVSATEGGYWDGTNVRWNELNVLSKGGRTVQFTVRVRKDAPADSRLMASIYSDGETVRDITSIGNTLVAYNDSTTTAMMIGPVETRRASTPQVMPRTGLGLENILSSILAVASIATTAIQRKRWSV